MIALIRPSYQVRRVYTGFLKGIKKIKENYIENAETTHLLHPCVPASTYALLHALEYSDVVGADPHDIVPSKVFLEFAWQVRKRFFLNFENSKNAI